MSALKSIKNKQLDKRFLAFRGLLATEIPSQGWIRLIRDALGMTGNQLASRAGISQSTLAQTEKREVEEKVTLQNLKKLAEAMECEFVYAFVPKKPIEQIIKNQAQQKAKILLNQVQGHMELEDQAVKGPVEERVALLAQKLIDTNRVW